MVSFMNLAKISKNGQITVPVEIREHLGLKPGDKILFCISEDGKVTISNVSISAIEKAQIAFKNAAKAMNIESEEDIQTLIDKIRNNNIGR